MYNRSDTIPACDRPTDRRTDRHTDGWIDILPLHSPRYAYASRANKRPVCTILGDIADADKVMDPQHFGTDPTNTRNRINAKIRIRIPDILVQVLAMAEVCVL